MATPTLDSVAATPLQQQYLNPAVQQQISQQAQDVTNLPNTYTQGLGVDKTFLTPNSAARQGVSQGGIDQTSQVLSALGERNNRVANDYVNNLKAATTLNAPAIQMQGRAQQAGNLGNIGSVAVNNQQIIQQQQLNQQRVQIYEQQQQQSIIAGILGIGGAILGGILGKKL